MLFEIIDTIRSFLGQGGQVLIVILGTTLVLWFLIIERFYFLHLIFPGQANELVKNWKPESLPTHWHVEKVRKLHISRMRGHLKQSINLIKSLVMVAPMLGLLGTVIGMIAVFDTMAFMGTGNARMMASGISMATIPTMAGMVAALSGLYFGSRLESRTNIAIDHLSDALKFD